jgi:hypothetical protein
MTIRVTVYQKNGLCRGPAIYNATFVAVFHWEGSSSWSYTIPLGATGPPPLSGLNPVYTVARPPDHVAFGQQVVGITEWYLRVASPIHNRWDFFVRDGEAHEVWLTRP